MKRWRVVHRTLIAAGLTLAIQGCGPADEAGDNNRSNEDVGQMDRPDMGGPIQGGDDTGTNTPDDGPDIAPPPPPPEIDLRADTNRNGTIDFDDPTEDEGEEAWNADRGAIFLANLDDDDRSCPLAGTDKQLADCFDANDEQIDGPMDLADMARLSLAPFPDPGAGTTASIEIGTGAEYVRLFRNVGGEWTHFDPQSSVLTSEDLVAGVEFALEGTTVVRDSTWNGLVDVTVTVDSTLDLPPDAITTDTVQLRVAPLILRHHLHEADEVYLSELPTGGDGLFTADVQTANQLSGVPNSVYEIDVEDQWTQDFFETAYMAMPGPDGLHVIDVYIRSANVNVDYYSGQRSLREAGRSVYRDFHGPDTAGLTAVKMDHNQDWDTLNSFGNTETIPPFSHNGADYPLGRIVRGTGTSGYKGDPAMISLLETQAVQPPLYVDTSWLLVAHIDETISFVKANTPRGWALVVNDPTLTIEMLQTASDNGNGGATMFDGKAWINFNSGRAYSARASIDEVLDSQNVMAATAEAAIEIEDQLETLREATGITEDEIVRVPFLHMTTDGWSVAFSPGVVNGISLTHTDFGAPTPHGPIIDGNDIFAKATEEALAPLGIDVHWIEDWDMYHRLSGEVHCGTNVRRLVPGDERWWESGR